jgi:hypothetical protein
MNILVRFMQGHPEAVDELTDSERVSFQRVIDAVRRSDFPVALDRELGSQLTSWEPFGRFLAEAYLPVLGSNRWRSQLESAAPPDRDETGDRTEWVTFAPGRSSRRGLALPEDHNPANQRVSLFAAERDALERVSVDYADGPLPSGLSFSLPFGCSLPAWGECRGEECQGDCVLTRVHDDNDGLVCRCPHFDRSTGTIRW